MRLSLLLGLATVALLGAPALADWTEPIYSTTRGLLEVRLVRDAADHLAIHWIEEETQVYAWIPQITAVDGAGRAPSSWGTPYYVSGYWASEKDIVPDGAGGAIVAELKVSGDPSPDLGVLHLLPDGSQDPTWTPGGVVVAAVDGQVEQWPRLATDGAGGAYVCWRAPGTVHLTRVLAGGAIAPGWPVGGVELAIGGGWKLDMGPDGSGGVVIGQLDPASRLFHYKGDGTPAVGWTKDGLTVSTNAAATNGNKATTMCVASDGGIYLAWTSGGASPLLKWGPVGVLRVTPDGVLDPRWPPGGRALSLRPDQVLPQGRRKVVPRGVSDPRLAADAVGGVYVVWGVLPSSGRAVLRAQRLAPDGTEAAGWDPDGIDLFGAGAALALTTTALEFEDPAVFAVGPDAAGGLFAAWDDARVPDTLKVAVTRVLASGIRHPGWPQDGQPIPRRYGSGCVRAVLGTSGDDAFVLWRDRGPYPWGETYLSRIGPPIPIEAPAEVGGVSPTMSLGEASRSGGTLTFICTLPRSGAARLDLFDVAGRRIGSTSIEGAAGAQRVSLARPEGVRPGVLFARLSQGREQRLLRFALVR